MEVVVVLAFEALVRLVRIASPTPSSTLSACHRGEVLEVAKGAFLVACAPQHVVPIRTREALPLRLCVCPLGIAAVAIGMALGAVVSFQEVGSGTSGDTFALEHVAAVVAFHAVVLLLPVAVFAGVGIAPVSVAVSGGHVAPFLATGIA